MKYCKYLFITLVLLLNFNCYAEDNGYGGPMEMWDNKGNYFVIDEDGSYYYKDIQGNTITKDEDGNMYVEDKNGYSYSFDDPSIAYYQFPDLWFAINSVGSVNGGPGVAMQNGWKMVDYDKWVYIENGQYLRNKWKQYKESWFYLGNDGYMVTGWQNINGKIFYFNSSGAMATGEQLIDGVDREFSPEGVLIY